MNFVKDLAIASKVDCDKFLKSSSELISISDFLKSSSMDLQVEFSDMKFGENNSFKGIELLPLILEIFFFKSSKLDNIKHLLSRRIIARGVRMTYESIRRQVIPIVDIENDESLSVEDKVKLIMAEARKNPEIEGFAKGVIKNLIDEFHQ